MTGKKRVLFLCTHNSCRSQMAEGIVNHILGDRFTAFSAGTEKTAVHPLAVRVLAEIGIDISHHRSKELEIFAGQPFDHVITLCGSANERCPLFFGGVARVHLGFVDPSRCVGTEAEIIQAFRRVRDAMQEQLTTYFRENQS